LATWEKYLANIEPHACSHRYTSYQPRMLGRACMHALLLWPFPPLYKCTPTIKIQ
uniref:Uncharacterized protein n=1 Tax=Oryza brachyantha TaxID=4533 RepID=J3L244_ORYBR